VPPGVRLALAGADPQSAGLPGAEAAGAVPGGELHARARQLRDAGLEFLVLAGAEASAPVLDEFRLVHREPGVCDVLALAQRVEPRTGPAQDGLPYPPPEMVRLVAGMGSPYRFYQRFIAGGSRVADRIGALLAKAGAPLDSLGAVLDFGCGCGRVMRHWRKLRGPVLHGTDYNPYLIEWCRVNLPFADFEVNELEPGLAHPDAAFDLVYAYSVFTHLPAAMQRPWLEELARLTRPGGHVFVTLHGESRMDALDAERQARFRAGELVVVAADERDWGTNACNAYHPQAWVRGSFAAGLEMVAHVPADEHVSQDSYLLRRPAGP
jgi:SAM-dependent methyltransferase